MAVFNRIVAALLWLFLLVVGCLLAVQPLTSVAVLLQWLARVQTTLQSWQAANATNFLIGQAAVGVVAALLFGTLLWMELLAGRRRGVRIRTADGGQAEIDTASVSRRLEWYLDQVAEVITVVPTVKSRGGVVDVKLEIEAAPDVDIQMKTDEVVEVTRDILEQDMGLKLGKLDVHLRCAPFTPDYA